MKRVFLWSALIVISANAFCQEINNISFAQQEEKIVITYDITGAKYFQLFNIEVFVSTNGGKDFYGPLKNVTGDAGKDIHEGKRKSILWNVYDEMPDFGLGGKVVFDVRATIIEKKVKHKLMIGYKGTISAPFGMMIGLTGKCGFYVSARCNQDYFVNSSFESDGVTISNYPETGYYSFIEGKKEQRMSVTGGLTFQTGWKVHLYIGGGLSRDNLLWQIAQYDFDDNETGTAWVKNKSESIAGFEAETGLLLNFGHFYFSAGVTSPGLKWVEPAFSAGFTF
jgi:hypothetical protein